MEIQFKIDNSINTYPNNFHLYITEKNNLSNIIDSTYLYIYQTNFAKIDSSFIKGKELKEYSYLIINKAENIYDTINSIDYEYYERTFNCNTCFLIFGADQLTCQFYKNLTITFNGKQYTQGEEILITK